MTTMLRRFRQARAQGTDTGITLIELIVSMLVMLVVFFVLGNVLINSINGQRKIVDLGQAGNDAQVEIASMQRGVRNAANGTIGLRDSTLTANLNTLVVKTWVGTSTTVPTGWRCQAWIYVAGTGSTPGNIFTKTEPPTATASTAPFKTLAATTSVTGWRLAVASVLPPVDTATPIFKTVAGTFTTTPATFTPNQATISFRSVQAQTTPPGAGVSITTSAVQRKQLPNDTEVCF